MLRIPCPFCGERDETEFRPGGEILEPRPQLDAGDDAWSDYLFFRDNPRGLVHERWFHSYGCGQWFNVVRDTVTHRIHKVCGSVEPRPAVEGSNDAGPKRGA